MDLVILAAGMGSRFGGLKQIEPIDKYGNFIIDYSIYDAKRAGFDRVVFIIKEENYEIFKKSFCCSACRFMYSFCGKHNNGKQKSTCGKHTERRTCFLLFLRFNADGVGRGIFATVR